MYVSRRHALRAFACAALGLMLSSCSTTQSERADIDARARAALDELYRITPAARGLADSSAGVLVFPSVTEGGLIIGGQYGQGVMFKQGRSDGHYNIAGGSLGLQAGAQTFSQAYFFTTAEALRTFEEVKGFEVGAGLDFAVADVGTTGTISSATLQKPLVIFVWGQQGLMAGVKVEGQKITRLEDE
ncbi:MAG TPA: YSC84-related protein [Alphaproteobacteria bacterium]|nr:YSC84-related protein [Alphaproteobacteria bacterium]